MSDVYGSGCIKIGDRYVLKENEKGVLHDLLISTQQYDSKGRIIVEKMKAGLNSNLAVGFLYTPMESDYPVRLITVGTKGLLYGIPIEDMDAEQAFMGASNQITDIFVGSVGSLIQFESSNLPIDSMVSVTEDYDGSPIVLTQVPISQVPTAGQYTVDLEKGIITIGVATATNYEIVYNLNSGRIKAHIGEIIESGLTVTTNVGTLTYDVSEVISVNDQAGNGYNIQYGTHAPVAGEAVVDTSANTITFNVADSVTAMDVRYRTPYKRLGITKKPAIAGEPVPVDFEGAQL